MQGPASPQPTIYVVDADPTVRDSLTSLLTAYGFGVEACGSASEFLAGEPDLDNACLVTEIHLPDIDGIELLTRLRQEAPDLPVIFIANRSDVPTAVLAIRRGAVDFIEKPFVDGALLRRIRQLLEHGRSARASDSE